MTTTALTGFRLSPQQKYLWRLQENNLNYLAKCTIKIQGKVKVNILKSALEKILNRHDNFRTTFQRRPGIKMPIQVILDNGKIYWNYLNLSNFKSEKQTEQIGEILQNQNGLMAQLDQQPIFPTAFLTLSEEEHILLVSLPALIADHLTLNNLVKEISESYGLCFKESDFDEEAAQYLQFSEWQNELLEEEDVETEIAYWQNQQFQWVNLPFENSQFEAEKFTPEEYRLNLDPNVILKLEANTPPNITIDHFLLACWQTLLWRLTKQSNITVKTVFSGRQYEDLEEVMGLLAKSLPISCQLEENLKFTQLLEEISDRFTEASERQEYFINSEIEPAAIGFEFIDISKVYYGGDLSFTLENQSVIFDNFKIKLNCIKTQESIIAEFQYNSELINIDVIKSFAKQFEALVASAVENIDATISELNIFSESEIQRLLDELNQTEQNYPQDKLIYQIFESQVELYPNNIAVVFEDQKLTYAELNSQANQLAHYLQKIGVETETIVGIFMERSLEVIIAILAILKAGAAYLPLDTKLPEENLAFRLEDAGVNILLSQSEIAPKNLNQNIKIITKTDENIAQQPQTNPTSKVSTENLAYILYTSGSTGKPKGVAIEHQQILNYLHGIQEKLQFSSIATSAIVSTFAADLGNTVIFPTLCSGGCLHIISQECASDATALANYFQRHPIDYLKIVPSHLSTLLTSNPSPFLLPRQCLILGGEAATWDLIAKIQEHSPQCRILNHYGPTETTVGALTYPVDNSNSYNAKTVPIGRPLANTKVYILDEKSQPVPVGVPGELHIGGAGLARGYLNHPELTADKFLEIGKIPPNSSIKSRGIGNKLYKTGDLARYLPDGNIEFIGRIDNQVKIHGFRVELGEVKTAINQHPAVAETVVMLREDEPDRQRLVAYVVLNQKLESLSEKLRDFLTKKLLEPTIPSIFVPLKSLPLTANGKIDRKALPTPETILSQNTFVAPTTTVEKQLAEIWAEVLRVEKVGINDNFFELGGDSILSIQIVARANQAGLNIITRQLFKYQTIAKLAAIVELVPTQTAEQGIVTGEVPITPIQHWFFQQNLPEVHHLNQSVLLEVSPEVNLTLLEETLSHLLQHHDGLRLRFIQDEGKWQQFYGEPNEQIPFVQVAVADDSEFEDLATQIQASLNLSQELIKAALFEFSGNRSNLLLIAIHHLVVDSISWRILLEDFQTVYQQLSQGSEIKLPAKTTSFKQWSEKLGDYAKSEELKSELNYWIKELSQPITYLPRDYPEGDNTIALSKTVSVALTTEETQALLQEVPAAYQTQINDVLLTALVLAWQQQTGNPSLMVDLESHGREDIFSDVNLSRTTGWFTSIFPVGLNLQANVEVGDALKIVKEKLRGIPNGGIGYGLLRYLSDGETVSQLKELPKSDIRFNYLGQFDEALQPSSLFKPASESAGVGRSLKGTRSYLLDINGMVVESKLQLNWTYSSAIHHQNTIEKLAECYVEKLREIIQHCQSLEAGSYTPSDFPNVGLDSEELDLLMSQLT